MTRTTVLTNYKQRYVEQQIGTGPVEIKRNFNDPYEAGRLVRSDIVKTVIDEQGWRIPTAYTCSRVSADCGFLESEVTRASTNTTWRERGGVNTALSAPLFKITLAELTALNPTSTDVNRCLVKARNNLADRVASFGESIAEAKKTIGSLGSNAESIDKFISSAARKDWKGCARALGISPDSRKHRRAVKIVEQNLTSKAYKSLIASGKAVPVVADSWLAWNFGLSPIISDMVSLAILLGDGKPLRVVGKSEYKSRPSEVRTGAMATALYSTYPISLLTREVRKAGVKIRLDYEIRADFLRDLSSYGLLDAPATLWALQPYSFLVDFVLPVSEVLRSLTATLGTTFKGGSRTRYVRIEKSITGHIPGLKPGYALKQLDVEVPPIDGMLMDRIVYNSDPYAIDLWIKDPFDAFKVATTTAVLVQRMRQFFKP